MSNFIIGQRIHWTNRIMRRNEEVNRLDSTEIDIYRKEISQKAQKEIIGRSVEEDLRKIEI